MQEPNKQAWAALGKEVLVKTWGGDELRFALAASCFLAAASVDVRRSEGVEDAEAARVEAALHASLEAHKRIAEKKRWKDLTKASTNTAAHCTAHYGLATEQPLYVCTRCSDVAAVDDDEPAPVVCGACVRRCHMHKEQPKKGQLPRHILPIAQAKRGVTCECGTSKFEGAKQDECALGLAKEKDGLAWLNEPDRSFALRFCTDKCREGNRIETGHCWEDEEELVACICCQTSFHADCVEAEDRKKEEFVCGACLSARVPHLQAYLRTSTGDHGPRVLGRACLGGSFLIASWRQEIIKDESEIRRRTAFTARCGLRPLALVLSSCVGASNSDESDDDDDDEQFTSWTAKAAEAAQLLVSLVKNADEDFEDYIKQVRQAAHKEAKKTKQRQRKDASRQKQARQLATTICAALTWSLKDEEEGQDAMGKQYLPCVLLDLLCNEIDNNEDTDKASLAHSAATALATCLMNSHKSQNSLAASNRAQQLWSLIGSCKCDEARATVMAYALFVFSNTVAFFSQDTLDEMNDKAKLSLLLEIVTDSSNPGVRLHSARALAHLARRDCNVSRTLRREDGVEQLGKLFLALSDGGSKEDPYRHAVLILLLTLCSQDAKSAVRLLAVKRMEKALTRLRKDEDASFPLRLCANEILGAARPSLVSAKIGKKSGSRKNAPAHDKDASALTTNGHASFQPPPLFVKMGLLGRGAFAKVYKVRLSQDSDQLYALKQIQMWNKRADPFYFFAEAQILKEVKHENIIKTHTIYQDHSSMYFLQDLMDTTLDSVIHSRPAGAAEEAKALPMSFLLDVCLNIARGMDYLHTRSHPIVHRDLKPENILLKLEGEGAMIKLQGLKITDFGVSRYLDNPHNEVERPMTQGMGTTGYISPETAIGMQLKDDELWLKSDVWSFGVILSELLSRRKPYYGKITNEVSGIIEGVAVTVRDARKRRANRSDDKDVMPFHEDQLLGQPPKQLLDLMRRCLSLTISARPSFSDAVEVLEELRQSLPGMDEDKPALAEQEKRPKRVAKRRAKPTAASLVALPDPEPQPQPQPTPVCLAPKAQTIRRVARRRNKVAPPSALCTKNAQDDDDDDEEVQDKENVKPLANRLKKMRL